MGARGQVRLAKGAPLANRHAESHSAAAVAVAVLTLLLSGCARFSAMYPIRRPRADSWQAELTFVDLPLTAT